MRYFYQVIDHNGIEYEGNFLFDSDREEAISIAKEIVIRKVRIIIKNRVGRSYQEKRFRRLIVSTWEEGLKHEYER